MERLRSWMFVPGHSSKMVEKSFGLPVDVVMLDLEDGVVPAAKAAARPVVAAALGTMKHRHGPVRYVRINAIGTNDVDQDLEAVVVLGLQGIVVPKVETVDDLLGLEKKLLRLMRDRGLPEGSVRFLLALETAKGLLAAPQLAACSPLVAGLIFGGEDYSRDLGMPTVRSATANEFIYARSATVIAAVAAGVMAVDSVWADLKDQKGLERDARLGRDLGFVGKSLIHPSQIEPINMVFSPTADEVDYALRLIAEFDAAFADGRGSINFEGKLVDRPIYQRALATVRLSQRAGTSTHA
jgi:citrate lyase subunit beta / citryl-CoA lyase